jgi:hypothetical protein
VAKKDAPTVAAATRSWAMLEASLVTADARIRWDEHWGIVRALRRTYARTVAGLATVLGVVAGLGAVTLSMRGSGEVILAIILLGSGPFLFGPGLRRFTAATVAPFVPRPRHLWAIWAAVGLFEITVLGGLALRPGIWWAVIGAVLVAVPLWTAAVLEIREPSPSFPAGWIARAAH